jgi:hypothetical protein
MNFVLSDLFRTQMRIIEFKPFAIIFLYLIAELRLSRYSRYHRNINKTVSNDYLMIVQKYISVFIFRKNNINIFFNQFYKIIDQNIDGVSVIKNIWIGLSDLLRNKLILVMGVILRVMI